jgi:hypothetical protein
MFALIETFLCAQLAIQSFKLFMCQQTAKVKNASLGTLSDYSTTDMKKLGAKLEILDSVVL